MRSLRRPHLTAVVLALAAVLSLSLAGTAEAAQQGQLRGAVTADGTGAPLAGIQVRAYGGAYAALYGQATTAADGTYQLTLPRGSFRLQFDDPSGTYRRTYSGGGATWAASATVPVTNGGTTVHDVAMPKRVGAVAGKVTSSSSTAPVAAIRVRAYGGAYASLYGQTTTLPDGSYRLELPPGQFRVLFDDPAGDHRPVYAGGASTWSAASLVTVPPGGTSTANAVQPAIKGADCTPDLDGQAVAIGGRDLSGKDLRACDLRNVSPFDPEGGDLSPIDLSGADLAGAHLAGLELIAVDFSGADLRRANLTGARLLFHFDEGVYWAAQAQLVGAHIGGAILRNAEVHYNELLTTNPAWVGADLRALYPPIVGCECGPPEPVPVFHLGTDGGFTPLTPSATTPPLDLSYVTMEQAWVDLEGKTFPGFTCTGCSSDPPF
jgi:uncharacterized protein YjbI with pentapeptide repeats